MKSYKYGIVVGLVAITLLLAGCTFPEGNEINISYYGDMSKNESGFQMDGNLSIGGGNVDRDTFRNVTINLYAKNGTLLHSEKIGEMSANSDRKNVSISTSEIPHYVIIESSDFWKVESEVDYFAYDPDSNTYRRNEVTTKEDLPVDT